MYTLQNLYDYLTSGTALTVPGSFQEPGAGPGSTMKSTKQIGDDVKALFVQCDAAVADVKTGKKFFSTVSGSWGVKTGTLACPTPIPDWYTTYGPSGTDDVVEIGNMYVAKWTNRAGTRGACGGGGNGGWLVTADWANRLNWLGKAWRLPSEAEAQSFCTNRALLGAYCPDPGWLWLQAGGAGDKGKIIYNMGSGGCNFFTVQESDGNPGARVVTTAF